MKLRKVAIKNFRGYSEQIEFSVNDITALIGKNDIGKSTILDALDTFLTLQSLILVTETYIAVMKQLKSHVLLAIFQSK